MRETGNVPDVLIIVGSESDKPRIEPAFEVLSKAGFSYEFHASSAHRQPDQTGKLVSGARSRGFKVIIAGAGLSAALPGFAASMTDLPVIGVPFAVGPLNGLDALLATVQVPPGVPVATVGIDNAKNAAHLAIRILKG
ncbi:MAG: 5-(carboxyamino)imidazole ribonucleotide mutase [Gemmatimonadetes bacterium]|nr:MAG: 5-(carboxyamino)imidazole ribonucleotide mutase [Gemmatimonadota bacterium]